MEWIFGGFIFLGIVIARSLGSIASAIKGATEQEAIDKKEMVEKAMVVFQSMSIKIINTTEGGEQWRTLKENYRKALEAEI